MLDTINLTIRRNEFTVIIGPPGLGNSTLLSLISTLVLPSFGHIQYDGKKVEVIRGYKLADFRYKNVTVSVFSRRVSWNKRERAMELLNDVGLGDKT
ncbi:ATP-binding cassette domain-containing protein [Bacillus sp. 2205SS5-2]|uniref:ATP-binding cassette domain-containing protein n=1 Tax=Bacillus sp. 2205SS5-2 TaxID=3109031 RepID=UPI003FA60361